jgi:hypothetical protein
MPFSGSLGGGRFSSRCFFRESPEEIAMILPPMRSPLVWFDTEHKGEVAAKEGPALELLGLPSGLLKYCVENYLLKTLKIIC